MTGLAPLRPHWAALAFLSVIFAAATLLDARPARAEDAKASAPSGPLVVDIDAGSSGLDPERLRAAIERELGVGVRARSAQDPGSALSIRLGDGRRATVRFQSTPGRVLERTLELPADSERSYETIALLTGNLARDEASELIEELRRSRTSPDATASETPQPASDAEAKPPEQTPPPAQPPAPKRRELEKKAEAKPSAESEAAQPALAATPVNLSFFYPLALYRDADRRRIALELGFAHSRVGAIDVAGVTFGYLDVRHTLRGVGLTVGLNRVVGDVKGAQMAIGGNLGGADLRGAALAVGFNHRKGTTEGVAVAVGYNETARLEGAQISLVNVAASEDKSYGFQGGLVNAAGPLTGAQLGLVNVAPRVRGVQLGLVNVGGEVEGATVGLVNVADRVDGLALGLVNVVGNARTRFAAWADTSGRANVGIKYRQKWLFTLLSAAYQMKNLSDPEGQRIEPAFAIGGHAGFGASFLELDVQYAFRQATIDQAEEQHIARYRLTAGHDPVKRLGGFVGAALEQTFDRDGNSFGALGFAGIQLF